MAPTAVLQEDEITVRRPSTSKVWMFAGVFLTSFAALLLELSLTRLFSVVLFYHFAFLAISIALLGLGVGGVLAHLLREQLLELDVRALGGVLCSSCSLAIVLALEIVLHTSVSLQLSRGSLLRMTLLYIATAIPFMLTGLQFSVLFARNTGNASRLYGADLAGGALACLFTVPLLNHIGGPNCILLAAGAMAVAGWVWADRWQWRFLSLTLTVVFSVLITSNLVHPFIDVIYAKGMYRDPGWVEYTKWNSISRVEVDRRTDGPKLIVIDADAATRLMDVDPHRVPPERLNSMLGMAQGLTNILRPRGEFAIIGPGGGPDVVRAVANGSPRVTGIEINPTIVNDIMRGRYADIAHHLYDLPGIEIHVSDGRSFIRGSHDLYDVVQMTLVDTWASTSAGAFALSENNLYTVEAFQEYFEHLRPEGMIAVTRWEFSEPREALRVVSVAVDALHRLGVANPFRNFMIVSDGPLVISGRHVLVLAKRSAFTKEEEAAASRYLQTFPNIVALYAPNNPPDNPFSRLIESNDPIAFAKRYKFNVAPVHDDKPFFFFNLKLGQILDHTVGQGVDWKVNVGIAVLGIVLLLSMLAVLGFLIIPLALGTRGRQKRVLPLMYFVAIGLGYIIVETTFIQRFVLFLGHPTYALTVVVFLLLLSSGAGSLISQRWVPDSSLLRWPLLATALVLLAYVFLLPALLPALVGQSFGVRLLLSGALLLPLGFAMGMPFPSGLRALGAIRTGGTGAQPSAQENFVEWAWAMNASSSVLGSALAMVVAMRFGLNITLAFGAAAYCLATVLTTTLNPSAE